MAAPEVVQAPRRGSVQTERPESRVSSYSSARTHELAIGDR